MRKTIKIDKPTVDMIMSCCGVYVPCPEGGFIDIKSTDDLIAYFKNEDLYFANLFGIPLDNYLDYLHFDWQCVAKTKKGARCERSVYENRWIGIKGFSYESQLCPQHLKLFLKKESKK